jgi:hypothetical protein
MPTKKIEETTPAPQAPAPVQVQGNSTFPILALVFGLVSLTGFGLLLGIPAIVLASIALKRKLPEKGLSVAGLVTGIVSTVFSLLFLILVIIAFVWGASHPDQLRDDGPYMDHRGTEQGYESSRT